MKSRLRKEDTNRCEMRKQGKADNQVDYRRDDESRDQDVGNNSPNKEEEDLFCHFFHAFSFIFYLCYYAFFNS